jgi:hypothetical protein
LIALVFVNLALVALFVRAAITAAWAGMLFLAGFVALFGWKVGGMLARNRPRAYRLDDLPRDLLP